LTALGLIGLGVAASPLSAANVCVGGKSQCFPTLQAAVDAAHDGDTITLGPGTFAGGVTIDVSIKLAGAGAESTIIAGGGPVLTIGAFGASSEPTVSIEGVTITGGATRSSPESMAFRGEEGVVALGGGIEIPPNADFVGGATVTVRNSVITGNHVAPSATVPSRRAICPNGRPCPFAQAGGGGIDSWGTLTLIHTTISNNRVGSASGLSALASDADGGAITSWLGPLTIHNSVITGNQASATAPNGRFAEAGAVFALGGTLSVSNSVVSGNSAALEASFPNSVELLANGGGFHITSDVSAAEMRNTTVSSNSVMMTNTVGDATAFSGGVHVDIGVDFRMSNSIIADNRVVSATLPGSSGNAHGDSGGGQLVGEIHNTRVNGNTVTVNSASGDASAAAGGDWVLGVSMTESRVSDNHIRAASPLGSASVMGGGLIVDTAPELPGQGGLSLRNSTVRENTADAEGPSGTAQGGGIFNASLPGGPFGGPLVLVNSGIIGNVLTGSAGMTVQGGGLFTMFPVTLQNSVVAQNVPDQCVGC
jgi:hypothetical protein